LYISPCGYCPRRPTQGISSPFRRSPSACSTASSGDNRNVKKPYQNTLGDLRPSGYGRLDALDLESNPESVEVQPTTSRANRLFPVSIEFGERAGMWRNDGSSMITGITMGIGIGRHWVSCLRLNPARTRANISSEKPKTGL
jgi:hypothetical protein